MRKTEETITKTEREVREERKIDSEELAKQMDTDRKSSRPPIVEPVVFQCDGCKKFHAIANQKVRVAQFNTRKDDPRTGHMLTVIKGHVILCPTCDQATGLVARK